MWSVLGKGVGVYLGDCLDGMKMLPDNSIDSIVTDPPYGISFMGRDWDHGVPGKHFWEEMLRVLKPGGHFCVSDVVIKGELPEKLQKDAEMYAGCVSGAIEINDYINIIKNTGFRNLKIHKKKDIVIPVEILKNYMGHDELELFKKGDTGIYSITISAEKEI